MTITFLLVGAAILATTALFVVAARGSAVHPALAADNTAVGLRDASTDTLRGGDPTITPMPRGDWQITAVEHLSAAEDMLDCLEANGIAERELIVLGNSCFAVRWR